MRWEWGDLAYLIAVADAGTTLGAARRLGVNQTTCARRLTALERALGLEKGTLDAHCMAALAHPISPVVVDEGPVQEVVHEAVRGLVERIVHANVD